MHFTSQGDKLLCEKQVRKISVTKDSKKIRKREFPREALLKGVAPQIRENDTICKITNH